MQGIADWSVGTDRRWHMNYRAVLFDMDGVLIDSENWYLERIYEQLVIKYPWIKREELFPTVGMSGPEEIRLVTRLAGKQPDDEDFLKELEGIHADSAIEDYKKVLYPETREVLSALFDRGFQLAVASSSSAADIRRMICQCGLEGLFSSVISGMDLPASKPDPDIYLKTMEALKVRPQDCLIVEDSTYGIEAGKRAGARVAARRDSRFLFDQSKADFHISDLTEVLELVGQSI